MLLNQTNLGTQQKANISRFVDAQQNQILDVRIKFKKIKGCLLQGTKQGDRWLMLKVSNLLFAYKQGFLKTKLWERVAV